MKPLRATYTPTKYTKGGDSDGYDNDLAEIVSIVHIIGYDYKTNPDVIFIHSDGRLDSDSLPHFTNCYIQSE